MDWDKRMHTARTTLNSLVADLPPGLRAITSLSLCTRHRTPRFTAPWRVLGPCPRHAGDTLASDEVVESISQGAERKACRIAIVELHRDCQANGPNVARLRGE